MAGQLPQQFEVQGEERLYMVLKGMEAEEGQEAMPEDGSGGVGITEEVSVSSNIS